MSIRFFPAALLAAAASLPTVAGATTLVYDDFTDGGFSNGGDADDVAWFTYYTGAAPTLSVSSDTALGGGNALLMNSSTGSFKGVASNFSTRTLAVGEVLTLSMDFRLAEAPSNNAAGIRLGLAEQTTLASPATGSGYYVTLGTGTSTGTTFFNDSGTDSFTSGSSVTSLSTTSPSAFSFNDQLKHSLVFSITRTASGFDLAFSVDGGGAHTATDSGAGLSGAFNTIAVVQGGVATDFRIDNVGLTLTTVPEPSVYGLCGAGSLAAFTLVRRRRRHVR